MTARRPPGARQSIASGRTFTQAGGRATRSEGFSLMPRPRVLAAWACALLYNYPPRSLQIASVAHTPRRKSLSVAFHVPEHG